MRTRFAGMGMEAEKGYAWKLIWKSRDIHMNPQSLSCEKPFPLLIDVQAFVEYC